MNYERRHINGFEDYLIFPAGKIFSLKRKKYLKPRINPKGYYRVDLCKSGKRYTKFIARLIAQAFIPNPDNKPEVNHKNSIKSDNRIENLEWCTHSENIIHAYSVGFKNAKGSDNGRSKLNELQVRVIRKCDDLLHRELAETFNMSIQHIGLIKRNGTWKHV